MTNYVRETQRYTVRSRRWGDDVEVLEMVNGQQIRRIKTMSVRTIPEALNSGKFLGEVELSFLLLQAWRDLVDKPLLGDATQALRWLVVTLFIVQESLVHGNPICIVDGVEYEIDYFTLNNGLIVFLANDAIADRGAAFGVMHAAGWIGAMIDPGYFTGESGKYLTKEGAEIMRGMVRQLQLMKDDAQYNPEGEA
jgi:hypothetical protein